jgi:hypothetical protein
MVINYTPEVAIAAAASLVAANRILRVESPPELLRLADGDMSMLQIPDSESEGMAGAQENETAAHAGDSATEEAAATS